jgi:hypothetical protein
MHNIFQASDYSKELLKTKRVHCPSANNHKRTKHCTIIISTTCNPRSTATAHGSERKLVPVVVVAALGCCILLARLRQHVTEGGIACIQQTPATSTLQNTYEMNNQYLCKKRRKKKTAATILICSILLHILCTSYRWWGSGGRNWLRGLWRGNRGTGFRRRGRCCSLYRPRVVAHLADVGGVVAAVAAGSAVTAAGERRWGRRSAGLK